MGEKRKWSFSISTPISEILSLSLPHHTCVLILLKYHEKQQKTTRGMQRNGIVKLHSYLQVSRTPHLNPHRKRLAHHKTVEAWKGYNVPSPQGIALDHILEVRGLSRSAYISSSVSISLA